MEQSLLERSPYLPLLPGESATHKHSLARLPIAHELLPDQCCGHAHRIGYAGHGDEAPALYRLKVKTCELPTRTLPGFYVLREGRFVVWTP